MTIDEIAKQVGVSRTTISFYLNGKRNKISEKTILKIEEVIKKNNYKPNKAARELRLQKTNNIGIIVNDISQSFANKLFRSVSKYLEEEDYVISLFESHLLYKEEEKLVRSLLSSKANTIVIQSSKKMMDRINDIRQEYPKSKTRIIIVDANDNKRDISYVYHNSEETIKKIIEKAKTQNTKNIYFLTDDIKMLQIREIRNKEISYFSKLNKINFKTIITENNKIAKNSLQRIKDHGIEDSIIWTNNSEIAFNFYAFMHVNKIFKKVKNIKMVTFNRCFFESILDFELITIDTKTKFVGKEISGIIKGENSTVEIKTNIIEK